MKTKLKKTVVVTPNFRRIRVTKNTKPQDITKFFEKNRAKIIRRINFRLDDTSISAQERKKLNQLKQMVGGAKGVKDWRDIIQTALLWGYSGYFMSAIMQEALITEGHPITQSAMLGLLFGITASTIVTKKVEKQTQKTRTGEKQ